VSTGISMDRSLRVLGGMILIALTYFAGGVESIGKTAVIIVGLYGFITGTINFCPLGYFIMKEKSGKRKKLSAEKAIQASDVRELEFFRGMTDKEIGKILAHTRFKEYPRDTPVISEGKVNRVLSVIFSGQFKIVKSISASDQKIITTISDGETYGEMSFFDHYPPSVSVVSTDSAKVLEFDEMGFNGMIQENPQLGIKVLTHLMHVTNSRIRALNDQITSLGTWVLQSRQQLRPSHA
jgi:CRP/FNR family transcriptional regulator, cyclic AMP receptor protein